MLECPQCGLKFSDSSNLSETQSCPNCAATLPKPPGLIDRPLAIVRGYFTQLWSICIHPAVFFRALPSKHARGPLRGFSGPLVFALITHWIGTSLEYLWHQLVGGSLGSIFHRFSKIAEDVIEIDNPGKAAQFSVFRDQMVHWFWGTGQVIVDPFLTAASLLFTTCFVYLGARILVSPGKNGAPSEISFESALQIVCFGMSPAIFAGLPFFGGLVAPFLTGIFTIIGAKEVYRIGWGRATVVGLFPKVLFLGIIGLGFALLAGVIMKLFVSMF